MFKIANPVEFADRKSRIRPVVTAVAAMYFAASQTVLHPRFGLGETQSRGVMWAITVALLLVLLMPAVGFVWGRRIRELINDDVSRSHARTATAAAFWLGMVLALGVFLLPASLEWSARQALYAVVTPAVVGALLHFSWLEWRAQSGGR